MRTFRYILGVIQLVFAAYYVVKNDYAHATFNLLLGALLIGKADSETAKP